MVAIRKSTMLSALALLALAVVPYLNTLRNGYTIDDVFVYADNPFVGSLRHLPHLFGADYFTFSNEASYRPFCTLTYFTDRALWRQWTGGPHATNVLWYAATVLALHAFYRVLIAAAAARCAADGAARRAAPAAFLGAALFALHPVHSEVVNSLSFREDLQVGLLLPLAWLAYVRGCRAAPWRWFSLSWLLYALATLAKETAIVFPALVLVLEWMARPAGPGGRRRLIIYIAGVLAVTALFLGLRFHWMQFPLETGNPQLGGSLWGTLLADVRIQAHYLKLLLFPYPLQPFYPPSAYAVRFDAAFWTSLALLGAVAAACVRWRQSVLLTGAALWWVVSLAPTANIYPIFNPMAERYLYLASIGPCWLAGTWLARGLECTRQGYVRAALAAVALLLAAYTADRNGVWRNNLAVWGAASRAAPDDPVVLTNLAAAHYERGNYADVVSLARRALALGKEANPDFEPATAHLPLGCVDLIEGRIADALAHFQTVERRLPLRFDLDVAVYHNLAMAWERAGDLQAALRSRERELALDPFRARSWAASAYLRLRLGQREGAQADWARARERDPGLPPFDVLETQTRRESAAAAGP